MEKLIVTADIHGQYSIWKKFYTILKPTDTLIVAGDLFDTKYGNLKNTDFQPQLIRDEFKNLPNTKYYVYGNCDNKSFYPDHDIMLKFSYFGKRFLLGHGHFIFPDISNVEIVIEGHSHVKKLEKKGGVIFLNPGSASFPRDKIPSYAEITSKEIVIKNFLTGIVIEGLEFT